MTAFLGTGHEEATWHDKRTPGNWTEEFKKEIRDKAYKRRLKHKTKE